MPSERKIRKLYVNGLTICIEFFFYFFKFSASAGRVAVTEGDDFGSLGDYPSTSVFDRYNLTKIAKHVRVCIACQIKTAGYMFDFLRS